jgi:hypothetical protein
MQNNSNAIRPEGDHESVEAAHDVRSNVVLTIIGPDQVIENQHREQGLIGSVRRAMGSVNDLQIYLACSTILSGFLIGYGSANIRANVSNYEEQQENNRNIAMQIFGIALSTLTPSYGIYKCISRLNFNNSQNNQDSPNPNNQDSPNNQNNQGQPSVLRVVVNPDGTVAMGNSNGNNNNLVVQ